VTIVIRHPLNRISERAYILDVIFGEFLGLETLVIAEDRDDFCISVEDQAARLHVADVLLATPDEHWLQYQSLPVNRLYRFPAADDTGALDLPGIDQVPVLYGKPVSNGHYFFAQDDVIELGIDIFGSAFFMLTRYEESCVSERDEHGRFPYSASVCAREGIIMRPIVNEYLEILWACLQRLWPSLTRKVRQYECLLSHDVDRLFDTRHTPWPVVLRNALGDLSKRSDLRLAARRIYSKAVSGGEDYGSEPCSTFDFIMDLSEKFGLRSAFYFIPQQTLDMTNCDYTISMPWVRRLLRRIDERGHEVGLHSSYQSFDDSKKIASELSNLKIAAAEEGIEQTIRGGRQHYLRWDANKTWQAWEDAGLAYDSTLAYAETPGFRCGTCYEYPVFNLGTSAPLRLRERPLILMETSVLGKRYMDTRVPDALAIISQLAATCRQYDGQFTMLWHNDNLAERSLKRLYSQALDSIVERAV